MHINAQGIAFSALTPLSKNDTASAGESESATLLQKTPEYFYLEKMFSSTRLVGRARVSIFQLISTADSSPIEQVCANHIFKGTVSSRDW
jgi:hypothetical protein